MRRFLDWDGDGDSSMREIKERGVKAMQQKAPETKNIYDRQGSREGIPRPARSDLKETMKLQFPLDAVAMMSAGGEAGESVRNVHASSSNTG